MNKIAIQVVRPADVSGSGGQRLVVGNGANDENVVGADLAVHVQGPATAGVGAYLDLPNRCFQPRRSAGEGRDSHRRRAADGLTYLGRPSGCGIAGRSSLASSAILGPDSGGRLKRASAREAGGSRRLLRRDGGRRIEGLRDCATTMVAVAAPVPLPSPRPAHHRARRAESA